MSSSTQQVKAKQRREKFAELLREMFQLNQPELDFGLYRIMHARKDDINRFIEKDLPNITQKAFSQFASQDKTQLEAELERARKAAEDAGFSPEDSPKVKELQEQLKDGFDLAREEGEVYDALVTFFNRYYSEGDFLSRRVYKDGTYAIPYQGEEVVLHWANKDQYYIKSSETLRDYSFRLNPNAGPGEDPIRVHFKLVDAEAGAKDNNKESADNKRVFVLDAEQPFELIEVEANDQNEIYTELQCRFHFRAATDADWTDKTKAKATEAAGKKPPAQDALRAIAEERLLGDHAALPEPWKTALGKAHRKADGELADYSMLVGQLNNYTKKNNFDYFIHKDLDGFLTRELDFYIKNELLDWEDIASLKNDPARLGPLLSKVEVIRSLGEKIIAFLAQLENFQKKLWLKKKFVTETNYCITLDRLEDQPDLLKEAFDNEKQLKDWEWQYKIDLEQLAKDRESLGWKELLAKPEYRYMMVDTGHFSEIYKVKILAGIEGLDEQCDGLLINSENSQAIDLISDSFSGKVSNIFIDPPYNTGDDGFVYKDNYQSSSWMSMISERVMKGYALLKNDGVFFTSIGDEEQEHLSTFFRHQFGKDRFFANLVWEKKKKGSFLNGSIVRMKDYILALSKSVKHFNGLIGEVAKEAESYPVIKTTNARGVRVIKAGISSKYREKDLVVPSGTRISSGNMELVLMSDLVIENGVLAKDVKVDSNWIYGQDSLDKYVEDRTLYVTQDLYFRRVVDEPRMKRMRDVLLRVGEAGEGDFRAFDIDNLSRYGWGSNEDANDELHQILGDQYVVSYPKPSKLITLLFAASRHKEGIWMDYFAGSGSSGHAVINLAREDGNSRKYILVEMGRYFDSVIRPRMSRVVYSKSWESGNPTDVLSGISHCFKYMRLESYEDALGNLALNRALGQQQLLNEPDHSDKSKARQAYVMNYMLEVETRDSQSLLNTRQFVDPTHYKLNVRSASGDETRPVNVDLLETFNYLLGLTVEHIAAPIYFDAELSQGEYGRWQARVKRSDSGKWWFRTVYGTNRAGQQVLVVWRNLPSVIDGTEDSIKLDNAVLDAVLIEKLAIRLTQSQDDEVDVLYVNGDHNIAIPRNRKGEPMEQARIQLIEEAFHRLMFVDTEQGA